MSVKKEFMYKILLLGDISVGKTCILTRYSDNTFREEHFVTVGLDFIKKSVNLDNGKTVNIQIWDTAGQDRFKSITKNYYKGAHGIILIYDVTTRMTFDNVRNWINTIKEEVDDKVNVILVGNKIDNNDNRKVTTEEGQKIANEYKLPFYETSAKTGDNINKAFNDLITRVVDVFGKYERKGQKLGNKKKKANGCC